MHSEHSINTLDWNNQQILYFADYSNLR